jgi:HlyD family secretion protein
MRRVLLVAALVAAAGLASAAPARADDGAQVLPAITVMAAAPMELTDRIIASGLIEPVERVFVAPQVEGLAIEALLADVGDRVEQGDVLARLSPAALELRAGQLRASRASAEAAMTQAEAQLVEAEALADEALRSRERAVRLREQGTASDAARDQAVSAAISAEARVAVARQGLEVARAQIDVADAQLADVALNLRRTEVRAPVAGEITSRDATVGAIAGAAGGPMFVIVRDGLLELRADVAEQDLMRLAPGQGVSLRVVGLEGRLTGQVRLVEPSVDPASRLGRVRIALDEPERVRAGLFAEAQIVTAQRKTLAVPLSAVANGNGAAVLVVDPGGLVARRPVVTGIRDGGMVEIVEGLSPGETVVARAGAFVRDGDRIRPVMADTLAASAN